MLLAELELPWLFNSLRCKLSHDGSPHVEDQIYAHFCNKCQQVFIAKFNMEYRGLANYWTGDFYRCPRCGEAAVDKENSRYYQSTTGLVQTTGIAIPRSMLLRLYEYKQHIKLIVDAAAISFVKDTPETVTYHRIIETFTFNIKEQKAYFQQRGGLFTIETTEIDNPLSGLLLSTSVLRYLRKNSRAWCEQKHAVMNFLKTLRETVIRKLQKVKGYKMRSAAVLGDTEYGLMLRPIQNLIWRMVIPDGPNLKELFSNLCLRGIDALATKNVVLSNVSYAEVQSILDRCRGGMSYPQAVLATYGLPDTKAGRQMLSRKPIYALSAIRVVAQAEVTGYNRRGLFDSLMRRWEKKLGDTPVQYWSVDRLFPSKDGIAFYCAAKDKVGETRALKLLTQLPADELNDTGAMYTKFTEKDKEALWDKAGNAKSFHDACMEMMWKYKHSDYNLDVPEHIVNRLMMQKDSLKFYLPKTYHQLHAAGTEMHNCVGGTYPERMKKGKLCIVLVSDDLGKLKVCIELKGSSIVQAKLFNNEPVWKDKALLKTVQDWAKDKGLKIASTDFAPLETENFREAV